jgi:single-strand DNA-binding protein
MRHPYVNDVRLVGRLSGEPEWRVLADGTALTQWRLVVERAARLPGRRRTAVDTLGCVAFDGKIMTAARDWRHGDMLTVRGALRRWFWRAPSGSASRYQVEVFRAEPVA